MEAITKEIRLERDFVTANKTKILKWSYGLELILTIAEEDYRDLHYVIVCRNRKLNAVTGGKTTFVLQV